MDETVARKPFVMLVTEHHARLGTRLRAKFAGIAISGD
jgi:hypothetical protein